MSEGPQRQKRSRFAYVLARIANADLRIDASETAGMDHTVNRIAGLSEAEAVLVLPFATAYFSWHLHLVVTVARPPTEPTPARRRRSAGP